METQQMPKVGQDGFVMIDGEKWGTLAAIARERGITTDTLKKGLQETAPRTGRSPSRHVVKIYPESAAKPFVDKLTDGNDDNE